jgi:hypothetical protein
LWHEPLRACQYHFGPLHELRRGECRPAIELQAEELRHIGDDLSQHPLVAACDDRGRLGAERGQLFEPVRVVEDIDDVEFDVESRKKLFRPEAARSAGLGEETDSLGLGHVISSGRSS